MKCPKCHFKNPDNSVYCSTCGIQLPSSEEITIPQTETLETPTEELTRGSTFAGRYEIIEELGKGGMGKVYRVEDKKVKEEVALKLIKPEVASDKKTIERFSNELKMARKIVHKNVGRMYELMEEKGIHFITMEYVPGQDLKGLIRQSRQLTVGTTINIAKQLCEGLTEAHRLGVIHRDLKPSNIMMDKEGNVRIMDFGIARSIKGKGITGTGVMIGTPEYMSPEQVEGLEVDQRSDIYSLGVILYEMMTGKVPFEGETPLSIALKHKTEMPPDPKKINIQIPGGLSRLILRCLAKDKQERFQDVDAVISELRSVEEEIPTREKAVPKRKLITSREITVTFGLKKLLIPALVVTALVIAVVVILQYLPKEQAIVSGPLDKPTLAVMYFKNNTGDESLNHWRRLSDLLIADLSQSRHLRILREEELINVLRDLELLKADSYSEEDLKQIGNKRGVKYILQGDYTKDADIFTINVRLQEASTGDLIGVDKVEGKGEESLFSLVDELTKGIKLNLKLSPELIAKDVDKEVGSIVTSSPEAFKYYSEGMKWHNNSGYFKSIPLFEQAVAVDPKFAMAYRTMAYDYEIIENWEDSKNYLRKSLELKDRLSDREWRLIQGHLYMKLENKHKKAIKVYSKLLQLYPEDVEANICIGKFYVDLEQWDRAIERFEAIKKQSGDAYYGLLEAYKAEGLYDKVEELIESRLVNNPDDIYILSDLVFNYICQGKYDLGSVEAEKIFLKKPRIKVFFDWCLGDLYFLKGDLIKAEETYKKIMEKKSLGQFMARSLLSALYIMQGRLDNSKDLLIQGIDLTEKGVRRRWNIEFHLQLAYLYLILEKPKEALEECSNAWNSAGKSEGVPQKMKDLYFRYALYLRGLAYLEMKSLDEAQKVASDLKKFIKKGTGGKKMRFYYQLIGMIKLENDKLSKAIDSFNEAIALLPSQYSLDMFVNNHAIFIDSLASAYYRAGYLDKAREEYQRILSLTTGRIYYGDVFVKCFYMQGKIYQEKSLRTKTIENYEKFLHLWKDANPGIAEVKDAKERLAGLRGK